jgi:hypothetical protein
LCEGGSARSLKPVADLILLNPVLDEAEQVKRLAAEVTSRLIISK